MKLFAHYILLIIIPNIDLTERPNNIRRGFGSIQSHDTPLNLPEYEFLGVHKKELNKTPKS